MEMAGLVEVQVNNACTSLVNHDMELAEEVRDVEARLNQFEVGWMINACPSLPNGNRLLATCAPLSV